MNCPHTWFSTEFRGGKSLVRRRLRLVGSRMELVTRRGAGYRLEADPC